MRARQGHHSALDEAEDLRLLLDHLGWERAILVGSSYCSFTALALAVAQPQRCLALALSEPPMMRYRAFSEAGRAAEAAFRRGAAADAANTMTDGMIGAAKPMSGLLMAGRNTSAIHAETFRNVCAALPQVRQTWIENSGHETSSDNPEMFDHTVLDEPARIRGLRRLAASASRGGADPGVPARLTRHRRDVAIGAPTCQGALPSPPGTCQSVWAAIWSGPRAGVAIRPFDIGRLMMLSRLFFVRAFAALAVGVCCSAATARVTRIVIDETVPLPAAVASAVAYEQVAGRAFGELDPKLPGNAIIQDIELAKDADGKVRYVASFVLFKPVDMGQASGLMWHDVPNRGRVFPMAGAERTAGDVLLASAWQGDNAGATTVRPTASATGMQWLQVPVARQATGERVTGEVFGRIVNRSGPASQPLLVQTNPVPYKPTTLDTSKARLVSRAGENQRGEVIGEEVIASTDWAWARCDATNPFPGTPDPGQICLKAGFDGQRLYQVVFTAGDPYVLGIGFAAWRDVGNFFKSAKADDAGTANPVAGRLTHSIARGVSQSGNYLRGWLHLGFNQAERGGMVHDGLWPIIAGRRIALNFRWAQPDGVLELYQAGSEGPQWWLPAADPVRGLPAAGILDRCTASGTCPKIMEHFGSAEVWALKLTPEWVGTDGKADLPLPESVRRYYIASSSHGGGAGGFDTSLPGVGLARTGAMCPGNNFGIGVLPANPVPHTETVNALRWHFRNWVTKGMPPPPSRYPTLAAGTLAEAHKAALGFPSLPMLRATVPEADFIMPVHDYDWGAQFDPLTGSGIPTLAPPRIKQVLKMYAPRVDADGNELGGLPVVLLDAPLGTYLGWNITAAGFHKDQICNYVGGTLPFARTALERRALADPRPSLEERYGTHDGYVDAVRRAVARAKQEGFLLEADGAALVKAAQDSQVLR